MSQISTRNILLYLLLGVLGALVIFCAVITYGVFKQTRELGLRAALSSSVAPSKIQMILNYIQGNYVDSLSMTELQERVLPHLFEELDPHSEYIPAKMMKTVEVPLKGNFDGIGVTFTMITDTIIVQSVIAGGPSQKVGIQIGDRFITIEGDTVAGKSVPQDSIVSRLRGPRGTKVTVGVQRYGNPELIPIQITRDQILLNSVEVAYMLDEKTGFIRLSRFAQTTPQDFQKALMELSMRGMQQVVLDLRGNGGGYLGAAHFIAGQFLHMGDTIVYTEGRARERSYLLSLGEGPLRNIPLVVLIDEFSASGSEIVAGAVQDNDRGVIVGRRSFGKGLVQEQIVLSDGSGLRLTTQRYYTPSGRSIQKPYELGGGKEYDLELEQRWKHGEFVDPDSIMQDTTQRYYTRSGRVVYGGGGIMPDRFVALDTTSYGPYYRAIMLKALHLRFAQEYLDAHREELNRLGSPQDLVVALEQRGIENTFNQYARKQGVTAHPPKPGDPAYPLLKSLIHACIARGIFDNNGFYPIYQEQDPVVQMALKIINDPETMRTTLRPQNVN